MIAGFRHRIRQKIQALYPAQDLSNLVVEATREESHGDLATNAALVLCKPVGKKPQEIAAHIADSLRQEPDIEWVKVAGPGFVNIRLVPSFWQQSLKDILKADLVYGNSTLGQNKCINVEYISANPTGPLHAAHARGAVVGDVLATLLEKVGFKVCREYYINDAGAQVDTLARSTFLRYREALGETVDIPSGYYPGAYLKDVGKALADQEGDQWKDRPEDQWLPLFREFAITAMMRDIKQDLKALGMHNIHFSSERALMESGAVEKAFQTLTDKDLIYTGVLQPPKGHKTDHWEARPQTLFRATAFGDECDRPLKKSDESWTYFASDIAYHFDKYQRGASLLVNVWGADHGGYVKRLQAAVDAITDGKATLDVKICQMVHMKDRGKIIPMSKRAGTFITLRDVIDTVGKDVIRFIMLTRRNDQTLDFDYARVQEQSRDNPVFYVQYAHARCCSVLRHIADMFPTTNLSTDALSQTALSLLTETEELLLIKKMSFWPQIVEAAAQQHEPHRIAFYLYDLASIFHALWTKGKDRTVLRFITPDDESLTLARAAMVKAVSVVLKSGLSVMGVVPLEEMH